MILFGSSPEADRNLTGLVHIEEEAAGTAPYTQMFHFLPGCRLAAAESGSAVKGEQAEEQRAQEAVLQTACSHCYGVISI